MKCRCPHVNGKRVDGPHYKICFDEGQEMSTKLPPDLERAMLNHADEYIGGPADDSYVASKNGFMDGARALYAELLKAQPEFDELTEANFPEWTKYAHFEKVCLAWGARYQFDRDQAKLSALAAERDAYAKAMAVALREGIFANKEEVKRLLSKALGQGGEVKDE